LELESHPESGTHIRGLFGPDPTLWTLFMFLHFIVAGVFVIFGVMAYSNWTLKQPILWNIFIMGMMVGVWFMLYVVARQIREQGIDQMHDLEALMEEALQHESR
jgi:ABC-type thiamin/hydroxymethylpyrimidine transport system permease subunit